MNSHNLSKYKTKNNEVSSVEIFLLKMADHQQHNCVRGWTKQLNNYRFDGIDTEFQWLHVWMSKSSYI